MNVVGKKMPPGSSTVTPGKNPEPVTCIVNAGLFRVGNGDTESMIMGASAEFIGGLLPPQPS
jgi:hypothetical protein